RDAFDRRIAIAKGEAEAPKSDGDGGGRGCFGAALAIGPIIELCKCSPGMVTAMGVSVGLTSAAIDSRGTIAQRERWVPDLLTMDKIRAGATTEPGSGSDAFGSMKAVARRDGDEYLLNGSKT